MSRAEDRTGYAQLCVEMIELAVHHTKHRDERVREHARRWIDGRRGRMSFVVCCDAVGLDPDAVRERITRTRRAS